MIDQSAIAIGPYPGKNMRRFLIGCRLLITNYNGGSGREKDLYRYCIFLVLSRMFGYVEQKLLGRLQKCLVFLKHVKSNF
jgi:hypothetical protein